MRSDDKPARTCDYVHTWSQTEPLSGLLKRVLGISETRGNDMLAWSFLCADRIGGRRVDAFSQLVQGMNRGSSLTTTSK